MECGLEGLQRQDCRAHWLTLLNAQGNVGWLMDGSLGALLPVAAKLAVSCQESE